MDLGMKLKELRSSKGLNQSEVAKMLNIDRSTYGKYETGDSSPDYEKLNKLASFFNVSTDYLLGKTAFKKPTELFEYWSGHNNPYFESPFDFGELLKKERELQGVQQEEVSEALGITVSDVDDIEDGVLPLNYAWAEKYANFLGTSVRQIFIDNGMDVSLNDIPLERLRYYQGQGMDENEMSIAERKFRKAEYHDAMNDPYPRRHLNHKNDIETIAAHRNADDDEEWTEEELKQIEEFKEFVRSRRKQTKGE